MQPALFTTEQQPEFKIGSPKIFVISPMNIRATVNPVEHVKELSAQISLEGFDLSCALKVNKLNGQLRIMAGSCRWRAAMLLSLETIPFWEYEGLPLEDEARISRQDNLKDERHLPEHFLDIGERYAALQEEDPQRWTNIGIAKAYYQEGEKKHTEVSRLISIARIPEVAKHIIRGEFDKLPEFCQTNISKSCQADFDNCQTFFKEGHFRDIIKLRPRRIIQICQEIVEHKGEWKHRQIKRRVVELNAKDECKQVAWGILDSAERRRIWREIEDGFHQKVDELRALVEKLNAEYSQIALYHKSFFDMTDEEIPNGSIDLIYADPPYGLSDGGITYHSGKIKSVDKGEWDKTPPDIDRWVALCVKKLKDGGSLYVSGTLHNIYDIGVSLRKHGLTIRNEIIWEKAQAAPTIIPKYYAFWHETVLFATKGKDYFFDAEQIKKFENGKQVKDIWRISPPSGSEKVNHSTQKPEALLERIITISRNLKMTDSIITRIYGVELHRNFILFSEIVG